MPPSPLFRPVRTANFSTYQNPLIMFAKPERGVMGVFPVCVSGFHNSWNTCKREIDKMLTF